MPDGSRNILDNVTPALNTALPVRIPGASGHTPAFVGLPAPRKPLGRDLPVIPGSDAATIRASIDAWDHIPTARTAAGSYTRKSLTAAIEADASENDRVIPKFPGQRRSPEQKPAPVPGQRTSAYDDVVLGFQYDGLAADAAFGGAA